MPHADPTLTPSADPEGWLVVARSVRWDFPSSSGRPLAGALDEAWTQRVEGRVALGAATAALLEVGQVQLGLELGARMWRVWVLARDEAGGRAWLASLLDAPEAAVPSRWRALALYGDGLLAFRRGQLADSRARNAAALDLAVQLADVEAEGLARLGLSRVALSEGDGSETLEQARAAHARLSTLGQAHVQASLHMRAQAARLVGDAAEAVRWFRESLDLNRVLGDALMVLAELHNLGHALLDTGDVEAAARSFAEGEALEGEGTDAYGRVLRALNAGCVALARGDAAAAQHGLEQARAIAAGEGVELAVDDARILERLSHGAQQRRRG